MSVNNLTLLNFCTFYQVVYTQETKINKKVGIFAN
jgi:hypothetical protein